MSEAREFLVGEHVTLTNWGGVWKVIGQALFQGVDGGHQLELEFVAGVTSPWRTKPVHSFSSVFVRKLTEMEVIALAADD